MAEFRVKIVHDGKHDAQPVNGASGGPSLTGETITMHLYHDHNTIAETMTHKVAEDGRVDMRVGTEQRDSEITRVIKSTSVIPVGMARVIGQWLITQADKAEAQRSNVEQVNQNEEENTT